MISIQLSSPSKPRANLAEPHVWGSLGNAAGRGSLRARCAGAGRSGVSFGNRRSPSGVWRPVRASPSPSVDLPLRCHCLAHHFHLAHALLDPFSLAVASGDTITIPSRSFFSSFTLSRDIIAPVRRDRCLLAGHYVEASRIAARPSVGQGRASAPSTGGSRSRGRPPSSQVGRLSGQAAPV